jgi:hypothetical protein
VAEASHASHEAPGVSTGWVVAAVAGLLGLIVIALLLTGSMFWFSGNSMHDAAPSPVSVADGPHLQIDPSADLARLKARDARRLHQGATVDIDEAMRRVAGRADPYAPVAGGDQEGQ